MKKNISINLFGTLYNIDEDAYNLLESYLQSMQRYFSRQEGGEEIADDIEHRVAELLWQKKEAGMEAVNIDVVKEIIATIGKAEEIGGEDSADESTREKGETNSDELKGSFQQFAHEAGHFAREAGNYARDAYDKGRKHVSTHRFYRRTDDKVVAGVCSGMVPYFESGDPLIWRLGAVLATVLLSFIGIGIIIPVTYILLWMLAPVAETPEDRLRMQGKEVTPDTLAQQVVEETNSETKQNNHPAGGCLKILLILLGALLLIPLLTTLISLIIGLITVGGISSALVMGTLGTMPFFPEMSAYVMTCRPMLIGAMICGFIVLVLPVEGIIRMIRGSKSRPAWAIITSIICWVLAAVLGAFFTIGAAYKMSEYNENRWGEKLSVTNFNRSRSELQHIGWSVSTVTNLDNNFTDSRTGYAGLPRYSFNLMPDNEGTGSFTAIFHKKGTLTEGHYTFMALTEGASETLSYTLSYTDKGEQKETSINPMEPGIFLHDASWEDFKDKGLFPSPDPEGWETFAHDGEDWVFHQVDIPHADSCQYTITIHAESLTPIKIREVKVVKVS